MEKKFRLQQSMRWYGPGDPVSLQDIAQSGCTHVVSALHAIPVGEIWPVEAIQKHIDQIKVAGLEWTVVESLPVHEDIKSQKEGFNTWIANYKKSLHNLAQCGLQVITYNFMPVLDWVRTDISYRLPNGSEALLFNRFDYAAFDLFMLRRPGAEKDYSPEEVKELSDYFKKMSEERKKYVFRNVLLGLPGSDVPFTPEQVLKLLDQYKDISRDQLKQNLIYFLQEIAPVAEELGLQLAIHPDDPPYSVLGLPRIMSTEQDIQNLMTAVPNKANGLCFCTGSLGARPDNDPVNMFKKWGSRAYFLHLRNTKRDENGHFMEANHLEGDTDMFAMMSEIVALMQQEQRAIPMRPDHGHKMLDDLGKTTYPGYSAIGRLKGLAELRGLEYAVHNIKS